MSKKICDLIREKNLMQPPYTWSQHWTTGAYTVPADVRVCEIRAVTAGIVYIDNDEQTNRPIYIGNYGSVQMRVTVIRASTTAQNVTLLGVYEKDLNGTE